MRAHFRRPATGSPFQWRGNTGTLPARWLGVVALTGLLCGVSAVEGRAQEARPLYVMNADGTDARPLTSLPDYTVQGSPDWSADGTRIAFDAWRPSESGGQAHVLLVDADGDSARDLGPGAMPSLSPRARRIAFTSYSPRGVWVMNADGTDRQLLDSDGWGTAWSPDGRKIAYTTFRGLANICVYDLVEGTRELLFEPGDTHYQQIFWNLCWSPDSKRLCFQGVNRSGDYQIAIISAEGAQQGLTVRLGQDQMPARGQPTVSWSPDGKRVLFAARDPQRKRQQIYWFDPDSDDPPQRLAGQPEDRLNVDPAWSPDGKQIVFHSEPVQSN